MDGELIVEANIPPAEAEEALKPLSEAERIDDALEALMKAVEVPQAGGGPPKRRTGESTKDYETRLVAYYSRKEKEAEDEAAGLGDGAGPTPAVPDPTAEPEAKRAKPTETAFPQTKTAYEGMIAKLDSLVGGAKNSADAAGAWLLNNIPGFAKTVATGVATKTVVDNPYTVAQLGKLLTQFASFGVERLQMTADWRQYTDAIGVLADSMGEFGETVRQTATAGPGFAIVGALLIMRYRASQPGGAGSVTRQILADGEALANLTASFVGAGAGAGAGAGFTARDALSRASEILFAALANARRTAQGAANVAALREAAERTKMGPRGEGAEAIRESVRAKGAPAVEPGVVPGALKLIPSKEVPSLASAVDRLASIRLPTAEKEELKSVLGKRKRRLEETAETPPPAPVAPPAAAPAALEASASGDITMEGTEEKKGGRRKKRKTYRKKGKKSRGKTRGRRAFIY